MIIFVISDLEISLKLFKKINLPFKSKIAIPTFNPGSNPTIIGAL
jgi:hypothetical protein